jgi:intracellular multiplication protein IcmO
MFAQARSLGTSMIAAAQDLEKLMEGSRAAEAGAMLANQTIKNFMRIDDAGKTAEMIQKITGKANVAVKRDFRAGAFGFERTNDLDVVETERVSLQKLQSFGQGEGIINAVGRTHFMKWFYMGKDIEKHRVPKYRVNRFLQVPTPTTEEVIANSLAIHDVKDPYRKGQELVHKLTQRTPVDLRVPPDTMITALQAESMRIGPHVSAEARGIRLYMAARAQLLAEDAQMSQQEASGGLILEGEDEELDGATTATRETSPAEQPVAMDMGPEDDLLAGVLGFATPFQRKPTEILGLDQAIVLDAAPVASPLSLDPFEALVQTPGQGAALTRVAQLQRDASISRVLPTEGGAAPAFVGAPDDWIALATGDAVEMVHAPRSSDDTVVGFTQATMDKVVVAEELLRSADPPAGARHVERVVAARITPVTRPESLKDEDDIFSLLDTLEEKTST